MSNEPPTTTDPICVCGHKLSKHYQKGWKCCLAYTDEKTGKFCKCERFREKK